MNWTSRAPIADAKCIVETNTGSLFPARFSGGAWWHTERGFMVEGVTRWIIYPEGEEPNDYIPAECLLKYVMKEYRTATEKLEAVRNLNQQLVKEFGKAVHEADLMEVETDTGEQKIEVA